MKFLLLIIVVVIAGAAGYLTEPNFRMQLTGKPADIEKPETDPKSKPEVDDETPIENNPVTSPPAVATQTPDPVVAVTPETVPYEPPSSPTSAPEVVIEQPQAPVTQPENPAQTADVVLVMKASIASGQISKFTAAQVLEWEAATSPETIDGQTYQIGNVTYQAETPFGTKNLPAKALIKDGKVVRWISPKSGMQIE